MNSSIVTSSSALTLHGGSKTVRQSKKDFFASLPDSMGRSERERKFAEYAEQFSATQAAGLAGALTAGLIRITKTRLTDSGSKGSFNFEVVSHTGRLSAKAKLEAEVAALRAELAAARAAIPAPAAPVSEPATANA